MKGFKSFDYSEAKKFKWEIAYLERNENIRKGLPICVMKMHGKLIDGDNIHYCFKHWNDSTYAIGNNKKDQKSKNNDKKGESRNPYETRYITKLV